VRVYSHTISIAMLGNSFLLSTRPLIPRAPADDVMTSLYTSLRPILTKEVVDTLSVEELPVELFSLVLLKCARNGEWGVVGAGALGKARDAMGRSRPKHPYAVPFCERVRALMTALPPRQRPSLNDRATLCPPPATHSPASCKSGVHCRRRHAGGRGGRGQEVPGQRACAAGCRGYGSATLGRVGLGRLRAFDRMYISYLFTLPPSSSAPSPDHLQASFGTCPLRVRSSYRC
jgi:hypothetical protein